MTINNEIRIRGRDRESEGIILTGVGRMKLFKDITIQKFGLKSTQYEYKIHRTDIPQFKLIFFSCFLVNFFVLDKKKTIYLGINLKQKWRLKNQKKVHLPT